MTHRPSVDLNIQFVDWYHRIDKEGGISYNEIWMASPCLLIDEEASERMGSC